MAITIKNTAATPPVEEQSPHDQAATVLGSDDTQETITQHNEDTGESTITDHTEDSKTVQLVLPKHDRVTVGMSFKMPVAQYVMIEFHVQRATDCDHEDADAVYEANKAWTEDRINDLVAEQQASAE